MIAYVRVIDGGFSKRQLVTLMRTDQHAEIEELGFFGPEMKPTDRLETGEVGYIITGVKDVAQVRVGDTITDKRRPAGEALPGYKVVQPMVFTGLFPTEGDKFEELRDALEKLKLNDAALSYEPESSVALGFGFRCGFLGLLHMDIVRERLATRTTSTAWRSRTSAPASSSRASSSARSWSCARVAAPTSWT